MNLEKLINGKFINNGKEFLLLNPMTPRPWQNRLINNDFYITVDQFGRGMSQYQDGIGNFTVYNYKEIDTGERALFVRDRENGFSWDTGWIYKKKRYTKFFHIYGLNYSIVTNITNKIEIEWKIFVPLKDSLEIWIIKVKNHDKKKRKLSFFPFSQPTLTGYSSYTGRYDSYISGKYIKEINGIILRNQDFGRPHTKYDGMMCSNIKPSSYDTALIKFTGTYGTIYSPNAVETGRCSNSESMGQILCTALQLDMELNPGQEKEFYILNGVIDSSKKEHIKYFNKYIKSKKEAEKNIYKYLKEVLNDRQKLTDSASFESPDKELNHMANNWAKQQVDYCHHFSRGWGKGYRDTLGDAQAALIFSSYPKWGKDKFWKVKETLYNALRHQYSDGRGVRKWSPLDTHNYNDGPFWLLYTALDYLKESGDWDFLDKKIKFLDRGSADVFTHLKKALFILINDRGKHGMVKMRFGDWNDGINDVGKRGKGESVWTTIVLHIVLVEFIDLLKNLKLKQKSVNIEELEKIRKQIEKDLIKHGWDGNWMRRAYTDFGKPVGSKLNREGKMYMTPQAFSFISTLFDNKPEYRKKILKSVEKNLEIDYGCLLIWPAYTKPDTDIGRITGHVPGMWENGAVYCHGTAFYIRGLLRHNYSDIALRLTKKLFGFNPKNPSCKSGLEPFAITNCFFGPSNKSQPGFSLYAWNTGTAGWILRNFYEGFGGFIPSWYGFYLNPNLPSAWNKLNITRYFRNKKFIIKIRRTDTGRDKIILNGEKIDSNYIPVDKCRNINTIEYLYGEKS